MSNLIEKTIGELLEYQFFIPSYQRGYRWTEQQIDDLLSDIDAFIPKQIEKSDKKTWYSLQPVVVKKCDEITKTKNNLQGTWYEIIDGQQRLTSIFLIIHYANEMWIGKQKTPEFKIKYETRNDSFEFLKDQKIDDNTDEAIINNENIDFHHITLTYNKIHKWVKEYKSKYGKEFDNNDFQSKLKSNSKVIWYEVSSEKDAIEIFTRINMGKIPLTNAELIKALFLNSSNFSNSDADKLKLKQLEIASEWDRIEYSLQNDDFCFFINKEKNNLSTRIESILNTIYVIAKNECIEVKFRNENNIKNKEQIDKRKMDGYLTVLEKYGHDEYATFRFFSEKFKIKNQKEIEKNWQEIKRLFQIIEEWFNDRELYHKVGFLITIGEAIKTLIANAETITKQEFKDYLDTRIAKKIKCEDLHAIKYGKDNGLIRNILLLHNIQTMLNNKNETSRFPFQRYKEEKWDLEHIHAIATEVKVKQENQKEWLKNNFIRTNQHKNDEFNSTIEQLVTNDSQPIDDDGFKDIIDYVLGDEDNGIRNLCLLDRGTNRSYKNDSFKEKRRKIIINEKEGTFIPICTKNIFMKYYSKELIDLELWNEADRELYIENINSTIFTQQN